MLRFTSMLFAILALFVVLLSAVACGGEGAAPATAVPAATSEPATAVPTATTPPPTTPVSTAEPARADAGTPGGETRQKLQVATSSNILAHWAEVVGQDRVEVFSLLPPDADHHTFQPGALDITRVADADLVLVVGLSLEKVWLDKLLGKAAGLSADIVELGELVEPLEAGGVPVDHSHVGESRTHEHGEESHEHGPLDPHFWLDPLRAKLAVDGIADRLSAMDPEGAALYKDNAEAYNRELDALHAWIQEQTGALPQERRLLVTSHDSFRYFAVRYEFEVVGTVFSVSTEREPSAMEIAQLIELIESEGAPAVFSEETIPPRLSQRVSEETGAKLVSGLYTESLTEGGEADTYLDMMRHTTQIIVEALR